MDILKVLKVVVAVTSCQARVLFPPREARLSLAEPMPYYSYNNIDGHPGTYSFGYDVADPATGNTQFRTEERYPNGTVVGSYGYVDAWGRPYRYRYIADERGYRVASDPPRNTYDGPPSSSTNFISDNQQNPTESSITWARPTRLNKKKNNQNVWNSDAVMKNTYKNKLNSVDYNYPGYKYFTTR